MTHIDNFGQLVNAVKSRLDIETVVGKFLDVRNHKAKCPFHDDGHPSLSIHPEDQYFHCFACGKAGDVIRFVELYKQIPFIDALKELAAEAGVPLTEIEPQDLQQIEKEQTRKTILRLTAEFYHRSLTDEARQYLIEKRGFSDETIEKFQIGYAAGGLREYLTQQGVDLTEAVEAGVLKECGGSSAITSICALSFQMSFVETWCN